MISMISMILWMWAQRFSWKWRYSCAWKKKHIVVDLRFMVVTRSFVTLIFWAYHIHFFCASQFSLTHLHVLISHKVCLRTCSVTMLQMCAFAVSNYELNALSIFEYLRRFVERILETERSRNFWGRLTPVAPCCHALMKTAQKILQEHCFCFFLSIFRQKL